MTARKHASPRNFNPLIHHSTFTKSYTMSDQKPFVCRWGILGSSRGPHIAELQS